MATGENGQNYPWHVNSITKPIIYSSPPPRRPSMSLLLPKLTAYRVGQIIALYEHRTAVQGFVWDLNSFDQWGVELGKKLATDVKEKLAVGRNGGKIKCDNPSSTRLLNHYVKFCEENEDDEGGENPFVVKEGGKDKFAVQWPKGQSAFSKHPPEMHHLKDNGRML